VDLSDAAHAPSSSAGLTAPDDFYYASFYLPPLAQDMARTLEATRRAITDIPGSCSDRGVAHLKLAWWQTELQQLAQATPRHPSTRALQPLLKRDPAVLVIFEQLVVNTVAALNAAPLNNRSALLAHVQTQHGPVLDYYVSLGRPVNATARASLIDMGCVLELAYGLRGLRQHRRGAPLLLADEELRAAGLSVDAVRYAQTSSELRAVVAPHLDWVHAELVTRCAALPRALRRKQRLFTTLARCAAEALVLTKADNCSVLERRIEVLPLRKLWLAWRTARWG
jgi:15-cis-phytoene synthase